MITIELEENEDIILVSDTLENSKGCTKDFDFKRKLILQVRKHRILYDNRHKFFSNVSKKDVVWQKIANKLKSNVENCKDTWLDLRYSYQRHARRLRNYFVHGHQENRKRPAMSLETELMFLWRVIGNRKTCEISFEIKEDDDLSVIEEECCIIEEKTTSTDVIQKPIDDDLILVETPVELIVIDEDDDKTEKQFKLNATMKTLIRLIKTYPEIYDSNHKDFTNYTRKSFLWNAIASTMSDKATKLMKSWIVMKTRYEWEISQTPDKAKAVGEELQNEFNFFKDFILQNPDTVYKQSHYLKSAWHDPIDYFKDIYNLIVRMKKMPDIVHITDSLLKTPVKSKQYITLWTELASWKNCSPGQCETTWLIMRYFYWELMNMRKANYQLTDKWYFESIITELYALSNSSQKQKELQTLKSVLHNKLPTKRPAEINATSQGAPTSKRTYLMPSPTPMPPLVPVSTSTLMPLTAPVNNFKNLPTTGPKLLTTETTIQPTLTLPKITAAISLAPQSLNPGSLQIKQISGPPTLSPAPFQLNNSTSTNVVPPTSMVSTQMSMSFNLPTQTKVTPITMPALIRPVMPNHSQSHLRNTTPVTISVRPSLPQIQIASWATAPRCSINSTVVTQIHNSPQPPTSTLPANINSFTASKIPANIQPTTATTPVAPISLNSVLGVQMKQNQLQSLPQKAQPKQTLTSTNAAQPKVSNKTTAPPSPKISLNYNTKTSTPVPPLESNTVANDSIQMPKITGAISLLNPNEILIELISSQSGNHLVVHGPSLNAKYQLAMQVLAKFIREVLAIPVLHTKQPVQPSLINMYWDYISNSFNLPVYICRAIWNFLLENFDHFPQIAPLKDLMRPFQTSLNVWVESYDVFEKFDKLSWSKGWNKYCKSFPDVVECISGYPMLFQDVAKEKRNEVLTEMESLCIWRTIGLRFPKNSDIQEIWLALKDCFLQYMSDLEIGIDNKWVTDWWRSLARMKFLVEAKYSSLEPFYYIIMNKMVEQIDKFVTLEMKNRAKTEKLTGPDDDTNNIEMEIEASVITTTQQVKEAEVVALLTAIQKYPIIYTKANTIEKYEAWEKVAKELRMEVSDCLYAFKNATEKYLIYKKRDPVNRLHINPIYYKKFDELVQKLPFTKFSSAYRSKIFTEIPVELNQSDQVYNSADFLFPERFISDINMSTCKSDLVVKNWVYAIGNLPNEYPVHAKLKKVLKKYLPNANK